MRFFFFFQAEDGIRDLIVTGVQTCALPICGVWREPQGGRAEGDADARAEVTLGSTALRLAPYTAFGFLALDDHTSQVRLRSEERRVGKEGRSRWSPDH